jgi:hypothetical protein
MPSIRTCSLICSLLLAALPALASDLTLEARLVWGANESNDARYTPVPGDLAAKLHGAFKWDNYFGITNKVHSIPLNQSRDFKMSDRCVLKIKNLGDSRVEVSCIGQGKVATKGSHTLKTGHWLVLGGNAKDNTAWFICLRPVDSSLADAKHP